MRFIRKFKAKIKLLLRIWKSSQFYHTSYLRTLQRCIHLSRKKGFRALEAFQLGLLDPDFDDNDLS